MILQFARDRTTRHAAPAESVDKDRRNLQ